MARWRWGDGYGAGTGVIVPARPHLPGCACCGPAPIGRRQVLQGLAAGGALAALSACTTNPATGRQSYTGFYSLKDDIKLGREEHPKLVKEFGGPYEHGKLNGYVTSVGKRLAAHSEHPELPYSFTILDTPIVNAFALPGGYVHVSRGLLALASNEAELAGVLAHEIGHVNARHTAERLAAAQAAQFGLLLGSIGAAAAGLPSQVMDVGQTVATLAIQGYSRQQEMEADMLGVRYMSQAGYDPNAMVSFLSSLHAQSQLEAREMGLPEGQVDQFNIMATHPRTIDRVRQAQAQAQAVHVANPRVARDDYLNSINGIVFDNEPDQGFVRGRRFVHPELRFEFTVPEGYHLRNNPNRVVATTSDGNTIIFDLGKMPGGGTSMRSYLTDVWASKYQLQGLEKINVNGRDGATGYFDARTDKGPVQVRLVAVRRSDADAFRFIYITVQDQVDKLSEPLRRSTYSLKMLSAAEAAKWKPLRLLVVPARAGDSVSALSRTLPYGQFNDDWFRLLNDLQPGQGPKAGTLIKVVTT